MAFCALRYASCYCVLLSILSKDRVVQKDKPVGVLPTKSTYTPEITKTMTSRHTVVFRAAQEAGAPHREYIDRKNENVIFTPLYLGDHLSDWNQICDTVARQPRESTFQI